MDRDIEDFFRRVAANQALERGDESGEADVVEEAEVLDYDGVLPGTQAPSTASDRDHWRFADDIEQSDERMASHLKQVFEHRLGDLKSGDAAGTPIAQDPPDQAGAGTKFRAGTAREIVQLLRSPHGVRAAVLLSEILKPPFERH